MHGPGELSTIPHFLSNPTGLRPIAWDLLPSLP